MNTTTKTNRTEVHEDYTDGEWGVYETDSHYAAPSYTAMVTGMTLEDAEWLQEKLWSSSLQERIAKIKAS